MSQNDDTISQLLINEYESLIKSLEDQIKSLRDRETCQIKYIKQADDKIQKQNEKINLLKESEKNLTEKLKNSEQLRKEMENMLIEIKINIENEDKNKFNEVENDINKNESIEFEESNSLFDVKSNQNSDATPNNKIEMKDSIKKEQREKRIQIEKLQMENEDFKMRLIIERKKNLHNKNIENKIKDIEIDFMTKNLYLNEKLLEKMDSSCKKLEINQYNIYEEVNQIKNVIQSEKIQTIMENCMDFLMINKQKKLLNNTNETCNINNKSQIYFFDSINDDNEYYINNRKSRVSFELKKLKQELGLGLHI